MEELTFYGIPFQEHGMAFAFFQVLFWDLPEDLIPFMFLYFYLYASSP